MLTDWSLLKPCLSYVRESESMDQDLDDWDFVPSTAIHLLGEFTSFCLSFTSCRMGIVTMLEALGGLQYSS